MDSLSRELAGERSTRPVDVKYVILIACAVSFFLALHAVMYPYDHDEEQFVAAGVLAKHLSLYRDFLYLQVPYFAEVLSWVYTPLNSHYFLAGRLFGAFLGLVCVYAFFLIVRRLTHSSVVSAAFTIVYVSSDAALHAFGLVRNDVMPLAFGLLSILSMQIAETNGRALRWWGAAGLLAAIAVGSKVSWIFLPLGAGIWLLTQGVRRRSWSAVYAYLVGAIIGILPVALHAFRDSDTFVFANLWYHLKAPRVWYVANGAESLLSRSTHVLRFVRLLIEPAIAVAGLVATFACIYVWWCQRTSGRARDLAELQTLPLALLLASLPFAYLPKPAQLQYTLPCVTLLFVSAAALYSFALKPASIKEVKPAILSIMVALGSFKGVLTLADEVIAFPNGPVRQFSIDSQFIRAHVRQNGFVATMSPIRVLDAELNIYPQLATGPFFFRSAKNIPDANVHQLHALSPGSLEPFLDAKTPSAILTGQEYSWNHALPYGPDESLERYASERGFRLTAGSSETTRLFTRELVQRD